MLSLSLSSLSSLISQLASFPSPLQLLAAATWGFTYLHWYFSMPHWLLLFISFLHFHFISFSFSLFSLFTFLSVASDNSSLHTHYHFSLHFSQYFSHICLNNTSDIDTHGHTYTQLGQRHGYTATRQTMPFHFSHSDSHISFHYILFIFLFSLLSLSLFISLLTIHTHTYIISLTYRLLSLSGWDTQNIDTHSHELKAEGSKAGLIQGHWIFLTGWGYTHKAKASWGWMNEYQTAGILATLSQPSQACTRQIPQIGHWAHFSGHWGTTDARLTAEGWDTGPAIDTRPGRPLSWRPHRVSHDAITTTWQGHWPGHNFPLTS